MLCWLSGSSTPPSGRCAASRSRRTGREMAAAPPPRRLAAGCRSCSTERQGPGLPGPAPVRAASLAPARATRCRKEVIFEIIYGFYCACSPGLPAPSPPFAARAAWPQLLTAEKRSQIPQCAEETVRKTYCSPKAGKNNTNAGSPYPQASHVPPAEGLFRH